MGLLALCVATSVVGVGPAEARKPITGVSCQGGFYVWMRDGRVFWIHGEPERKELVYSGGSKLVAMAMCDAGVLSVFEDNDTTSTNRAIYSPNCLDIGAPQGQSVLVGTHAAPIRRIAHTPDAVTLHFADGELVTDTICTRHTIE